jgi:hypothetical protein
MSHQTAFAVAVRRYGFSAAVRQLRNLGADFIDVYVAAFGRMPRV